MSKSSTLVPKRYQPRKWPVGKKPIKNNVTDFGVTLDDGILRNPSADLHQLLIDFRESLKPMISFHEHPLTITRGERGMHSRHDVGAGKIFIVGSDLHHDFPYHGRLRGGSDLKPRAVDNEAIARRDGFLQAAAYHDAIFDSWTKESIRAETEYKTNGEEKDLCDWQAASANAANHYDFANDMRRMAEGIKPRNAPMEFAEQTQMGTWSGRLKNLNAATTVTIE